MEQQRYALRGNKNKSKGAKSKTSPATVVETKSDSNPGIDDPIYFWKPDDKAGWLGQWYMAEMTDEQGRKFNCCEQYMMYHKAKLFNDEEIMEAMFKTTSPKKMKALGKEVRGFDSEVWDKEKYQIVVKANMFKFSQCKAREFDKLVYPPDGREEGGEVVWLKQLLLDTGDRELVEASRFDKIWGIGFDENAARKTPRRAWGQNLLGRALMEVRSKLREAEN